MTSRVYFYYYGLTLIILIVSLQNGTEMTPHTEFVDEQSRIELTINAANNSRIAAAGEHLKYDEKVWNTLCNQTFEYNEENVERLYEHLEPNEFAFLCDLLGNHVDLLKPERVCFYCGEPTSFEHCFANCEKLQQQFRGVIIRQ